MYIRIRRSVLFGVLWGVLLLGYLVALAFTPDNHDPASNFIPTKFSPK